MFRIKFVKRQSLTTRLKRQLTRGTTLYVGGRRSSNAKVTPQPEYTFNPSLGHDCIIDREEKRYNRLDALKEQQTCATAFKLFVATSGSLFAVFTLLMSVLCASALLIPTGNTTQPQVNTHIQ